MGLIHLAILVIVVVAVIAITYWFLREAGVPIPQPVRIALLAILAILAILLVANLAGLGPPVVVVK